MKSIVVVIPAYNEEKTIEKVIDDFHIHLPEATLCVIDNNSIDNTYNLVLEKFKSFGLESSRAILLKEYKQGKANAIKKAFYSIDKDIYIMIDADCTYDVSHIKELIKPVQEDKADMVVGDRHTLGHYKKENKRALNGFGNLLVKSIINLLYNRNLKDILSGYRVFNKRFVKTFPITTRGFELETEITLFALENNFSIVEIPSKYIDRPQDSHSKLNTFKDGYLVMRKLFSIFKNYKPLLFFGFFCFLFLSISLLLGISVFIEYLETGLVGRFPTAILAMGCGLLSIIFLTVALILDTIVKIDKKSFEYRLMKYTER